MAQHRILLADDSSTMHRAVKLALSRGDYEIVCCDNGTDALRIAKEILPTMVIADLDLPGISGSELIKALKNDSTLSNSKIILLCSSMHQGDIGRLDKIPADARLWKPFESEAIFTLVMALLRTSPTRGGSSTLSTASTQAMSRAAINPEATKSMKKASVLVDRTMPPASPVEMTAPPTSTPTNPQTSYVSTQNSPTTKSTYEAEPTVRSSLSSKDLTENLWSPDFDAPSNEVTGSREYTAQSPDAAAKTSTPNEPTEKLSAYREASTQWESLQARSSNPPPPPRSHTATGEAAAPTVSRDEIRNMIRAEIQLAFDSWFKDKLETKLQEILGQIESESKKRV